MRRAGDHAGEDRRRRRPAAGFTLLELVLAMLVLALLVGMVFMTAQTSLALGAEVVRKQNEEMLKSAFFDLLNRHFASIPGNAVFDLKAQDAGSHFLSDMTFQKVPMAFTWGGTEQVAAALQLSTVRRRDGFLSIVLRFYEEEILQDSGGQKVGAPLVKPFAEIVLLDDVRLFQWRVLDGRTMEWQDDWDIRGRLPLQVELLVAFGQHGEVIRQIFWLPPKANPEVVLRQLAQQPPAGAVPAPGTGTNTGTGTGTGAGTGTAPGTGGNVKLNIPPGNPVGVGGGGGGGGGGRPPRTRGGGR